MKDESRWDRDKRGHGKEQSPLVEEGLVTAKGEPYLLRERSADGAVRCRGESEEEGHSTNREDMFPIV